MFNSLRSYFHSKHRLIEEKTNFLLNLSAVKKAIIQHYKILQSDSFLCFTFTTNQLNALYSHVDEDINSLKIRKLHLTCTAVMLAYFIVMLPALLLGLMRSNYERCGFLVHRGLYIYYNLIIQSLKPKRILISSNFGISTSPIIFICRRNNIELYYVPHSRSSSYYKRYRHNHLKLFKEDSDNLKIFSFCHVEYLQINKKSLVSRPSDAVTVIIFLNLLDIDVKIYNLIENFDKFRIKYAIKKHPRDHRSFPNELIGMGTGVIAATYERILVSNSSVYFDLKDAGSEPYFFNLGNLEPVYSFQKSIGSTEEVIKMWGR